MSVQMEVLIKEVAGKHGIALGKDDPILMMHTINEILMMENIQAQKIMLNEFKQDLEEVSLRWGSDAKEKSERILNASLKASKESMAQLLYENAKNISVLIQNEMQESLSRINEVVRHAEKVAMLNILSSGLTLLAAGTIIFGIFFK